MREGDLAGAGNQRRETHTEEQAPRQDDCRESRENVSRLCQGLGLLSAGPTTTLKSRGWNRTPHPTPVAKAMDPTARKEISSLAGDVRFGDQGPEDHDGEDGLDRDEDCAFSG